MGKMQEPSHKHRQEGKSNRRVSTDLCPYPVIPEHHFTSTASLSSIMNQCDHSRVR